MPILPAPIISVASTTSGARALTAAPIFGQRRAPRWWLIRPSEAGTYCKIVIIWLSSSPNLGCVGRLDTAPQFCGLKHDHEQFSSGKCRCRRIARSRVGSCGGARREPRRRLRRMPEPNSGDRRGRGCRLKRSSDRKIAARLLTRCTQQVECRMIPYYRDFTISSGFRRAYQPPTWSALLTENWRGCRSTPFLRSSADPPQRPPRRLLAAVACSGA